MLTIPGYQVVEKLYQGRETVVLRARELHSERAVVLKTLHKPRPSAREVARLRHEYELTRAPLCPGIIQSYRLLETGRRAILVMQDIGGTSLDRARPRSLSVELFLSLAIQLVEALGVVHDHRIIHKDINPTNIIIHPDTHTLQIIDFGISSRLPREYQSLANLDHLEGTLQFISPEQTGRMNRHIDYRSDFYSLGVTFYRLLTDAMPFPDSDILEMVHNHIAIEPASVSSVTPTVPEQLSRIVAKLMAKTAEQRYQSAYGLKADLRACLDQWQTSGHIEVAPLGQRDMAPNLQIPEKLYGRARECEALLTMFDRCAAETQMVLVAGSSGIGKSALVHEIHKSLASRRGYFVSGKFDQFQRDIPYASLVDAFRDLARALLTESQEHIQDWRARLGDALGDNGQVIVEVIPELGIIMGEQPPVPELSPQESQARFKLFFARLVRVFATREHPLVLFLDDLQWADQASLQLVETLASNRAPGLLLIGAYRNNEVDSAHPLMHALHAIDSAGVTFHTLELSGLSLDCITDMAAETLHCELDDARPLASLTLRKTRGNPFFVNQFLESLWLADLLQPDPELGRWRWDIARIERADFTENVVELMSSKIQKLSVDTQQLLQIAACIGNTFDLEILAVVCERTPAATASSLLKVLEEGLIYSSSEAYWLYGAGLDTHPDAEPDARPDARPDDGDSAPMAEAVTFRFLHDRVQQAAYSLISEADKPALHFRIGQLLIQHGEASDIAEYVFAIANHLSLSGQLPERSPQRLQFSEIYRRAGRRAFNSAAFQSAATYFNAGVALLREADWHSHYDLAFALYCGQAECAAIAGDFSASEQSFDVALARAHSKRDQARVHNTKMVLYQTEGTNYRKSVTEGLAGLALLGFDDPVTPEARRAATEREWQIVDRMLREVRVAELRDAPEVADEDIRIIMHLLVNFWASTYLCGEIDLLELGRVTTVRTAVEHGNTDNAAFAYIIYAARLVSQDRFREGYEFGQLALDLNRKFENRGLTGKIYNLFAHMVSPYRVHLRENLDIYHVSARVSRECGDMIYAAWAHAFLIWTRFMIGQALDEVQEIAESYVDFMNESHDANMARIFMCQKNAIVNLRGLTASVHSLDVGDFDEQDNLRVMRQNQFDTGLCWYFILKTQLHYLYGDYDEALKCAAETEKTQTVGLNFFNNTKHVFYQTLAMTALYRQVSGERRAEFDCKLAENRVLLTAWADGCPDNFAHKLALVDAEQHRIAGRPAEAMDGYDRAIALATEHGYVQHAAIANELAAGFFLDRGRKTVGMAYLSDAIAEYRRWGATAKVRMLERQYPALLGDYASLGPAVLPTTLAAGRVRQDLSTVAASSQELDLESILAASQAISSEIMLSQLLRNLMTMVIRNAGAERGILLLEKSGQWWIEAHGQALDAEVTVLRSQPVDATDSEGRDLLAAPIVNYVARTQDSVVLDDAAAQGAFTESDYVHRYQPRSILCMPLRNQGRLVAILYLENNLVAGAFTDARIRTLRLLLTQAVISIHNARLYESLEEINHDLEQKVLERTQALLINEKMATLGTMTAGLAHEFNNPNNFIFGGVQALQEELAQYRALLHSMVEDETDDEILATLFEPLEHMARNMAIIEDGSTRIRKLVRDMRNFSRTDESPEIEIDLLEGLRSVVPLVAAQEQDIDFRLELGQPLVRTCRPAELNQVYLSLLSNACRAIADRSAADPDAPQAVTVSSRIDGGSAVIQFADTGCGIAADQRDRLFEAFYTTREPGQGTGLGLYTVWQIIERHGGRVTVDSQPGQGATFALHLPLTIDI